MSEITNKKPLVFCKDCTYFVGKYAQWNEQLCLNPNNIKEVFSYDRIHYKRVFLLCERNSNNNCTLYEEKVKFWKWVRGKVKNAKQ